MSKVLGIVAEYNPFHNGHKYHIQKSKEITGAKYVVAVISGNFTQRGDTSLIDKWSKTKMALENGVDLVIELPVIYAISSAENFADGAIKILNSLGIVDYISFGAETNDLELLKAVQKVVSKEPKNYKTSLKNNLDNGLSFPKARELAVKEYFKDSKYSKVLSYPNNILGIEYLKSLDKHKSKIDPVIITRYSSDYNDVKVTGNIASATAIRNLLCENSVNIDLLSSLIPQPSLDILLNNIKQGHLIPSLACFQKEIIYMLRCMTNDEIKHIPDVSEGLDIALKNTANSCNTLEDFINIIKSKRFTTTRIQRILLYVLLHIKSKDMIMSKKTVPYIRVLGFNSNGKYLISEISKKSPKLNIITSVKKFIDSNSDTPLSNMFEKDIFATNIYTLGYINDSWSNLDFTNKIISID